MEKKNFTLAGGNMPDDVYNILSEQAKKRNLTQYLVEAVKKSTKEEDLLAKLENIERKIENIRIIEVPTSGESDDKKENSKPTELTEGQILVVNKVESEMENEDEDYDF